MKRGEVLDNARARVCGDRDKTYKYPENSFALIARLWEPIIKARCVGPGADVCVDAVTVALCMAELKIARAATNETHMDSWVDLAGYAACGGELAAEKERKKTMADLLNQEKPCLFKKFMETVKKPEKQQEK